MVSGFDKLSRFSLVEEVDLIEKRNLRMWLDQMNSRDYVVHHGQATPEDVAWDSASNEAVIAHAVPLADYGIVNWILGEEATDTLDPTERALLDAYLDQDGALLISGSELGWEMVELGAAPDFFREVLRTAYVADDAGTYTVRPTSDGIFAGLTDLRFDAPGMYHVGYPDVLAPAGDADGAWLALRYVGGAGDEQGAAVQYADGCQRILVFGFPLETVWEARLAEVMERAMTFLGACAIGPQTAIEIPVDSAGYRDLPTVAGTAVGPEIATVWLQLARLSGDGAHRQHHTAVEAYWTGEAWGATEAWFPAVGTATWTYDLPPLEEGSYRLRADATREASGPDAEQGAAEATFFVDWTPPVTPTVITPTGGVTLVGPVVLLDWVVAPDAGSPVHFELTIDQRTVDITPGVDITPYRVSPALGPGDHRWRLRAVDAAGNASPYSGWAHFHVEVVQVFLPLVARE
jgi:hypothetical protein